MRPEDRNEDFYRGEFNAEYFAMLSAMEGIESVVLEFFPFGSDEYNQLENITKDFFDCLRDLKAKIDKNHFAEPVKMVGVNNDE